MTSVVSSYYLTYYRTYEDVVAERAFLTLLPLLSVLPMAFFNIPIGILIGRTKTLQGKARPYILLASPLLFVSGLLLFFIPQVSLGIRMLWMVITYNLFAAIANPVYGTAHFLMVSLSTGDLDQRGKLSDFWINPVGRYGTVRACNDQWHPACGRNAFYLAACKPLWQKEHGNCRMCCFDSRKHCMSDQSP